MFLVRMKPNVFMAPVRNRTATEAESNMCMRRHPPGSVKHTTARNQQILINWPEPAIEREE